MDQKERKIHRALNHNKSLVSTRLIDDRRHLKELREHLRRIGHKVVLTQGSFDLIHIGHAKYLEMAKKQGDILIVGVDDDEKIRRRKGEHRPVVPEKERIMMLTHLRSVDFVTVKRHDDPKWVLIRLLRPDVLVVTERMKYSSTDLEKIKKLCGKVVLLKSQATTSTSAKVRLLHTTGANDITRKILERFPGLVSEIFEIFDEKHGK